MRGQLQINMETHWKRAVSELKKAKARVVRCYNEGHLANPFKIGDVVLCKVYSLSSAVVRRWAKLTWKCSYQGSIVQ
jgi:hypothetical protein